MIETINKYRFCLKLNIYFHHNLREMAYDLNKIEAEDDEIDVSKWKLKSAVNDNTNYHLVEREPVEYFDIRDRYLVSCSQNLSGEA